MAGSGINCEFISINSIAYDVSSLTIEKGQKIRLMVPNLTDPVWFSNNDSVLSINDTGTSAVIECLSVGGSTILWMDNQLQPLGQITITVTELQAAKLGVTFGNPEIK